MPIGVPVRFRTYVGGIKKYLEKKGFREMSWYEVAYFSVWYGLEKYTRTTQAERGFIYIDEEHGQIVIVWTGCSCLLVEKCYAEFALHPLFVEAIGDEVVSKPVNEDMGWVLIIDFSGIAQYFAVPFNRTENFALSLCMQARITQLRVQNRPRCEKCHEFMEIIVRENRQTYWKCPQPCLRDSGKPVCVGWDDCIPQKAREAAEERREPRARRRKKERAEGIVREPARKIRARRKVVARKSDLAA